MIKDTLQTIKHFYWQKKRSKNFYLRKKSFSIPYQLDNLSSFQKRVLNETKKIEYGKTISYKELGNRIDAIDSSRAIGNALFSLSANKLA